VDQVDRDFVLKQINAQLEGDQILESDIISERSGVRPLVIEKAAEANNADWHALSRKHVIEANEQNRVISVLGGKLTDCLNVGQEVVAELRKLGFSVAKPKDWFGEGSQDRKQEFVQLVASRCADADAAKRISESTWRRQGERGFEIFSSANELTELVSGLGITEQEIEFIAHDEEVRNREDLLRRRLPVAMARSAAEIESNAKLQELLTRLGL
jgi:glycerol-3-phosphate dehydrogenase